MQKNKFWSSQFHYDLCKKSAIYLGEIHVKIHFDFPTLTLSEASTWLERKEKSSL